MMRRPLAFPALAAAALALAFSLGSPSFFLEAQAGMGAEKNGDTTLEPQHRGDPAAGERFVQEHCASCHALTPEEQSPNADAPSLATLERRWPVEYLAEALAEGIFVGHEGKEMPQFVLEPEEIDDLLAYLRSIQG